MGFSKNPLLDPVKSKIADIRHLEIDMTSFVSAEGGPISQTGAE